MLRFILALIILASAAVITQKLGLLNGFKKPKAEVPQVVEETSAPEKNNVTKSEVYRWVDKDGKVHFSDQSVAKTEVNPEKIIVSTETTEFAKTPKIKPIYIPSNRQTSAQSSRSKRCQRLKADIAAREKRLRRAGRIPSQDKQLSQKRWEKIKGC